MPAFTPKDPALADHLGWLGYVQPEGLVVSAPALADAQAIIDRAQLGELQRRFAEHVTSLRLDDSDTGNTAPGIADFARFLGEFLGWPAELLHGLDPARPLPPELTVSLPEFGELLAPSFAVARPPAQIENRKSEIANSSWLLLVQSHPATVDLDKPVASSDRHWHASPAKKFERLLRETGVPIGLLINGTQFRLIYAPPKENSGALTFPVGAMSEVSGRLILGAFQLLLGAWTLFTAPSEARLPALLQRSRDYQASVSEILAEQVLHALYELLRGFESADERVKGSLLRELAAKDPANIYGGLVTVLLRLVFTLFAEDRGLLPMSGLYVRHYSVRGLFERLRADAERYPDTMDHRFGAWAQLLALFRVIHGGCKHPDLAMPARAGHLFDPDRYPFLEGSSSRRESAQTSPHQPSTLNPQLPLVSDGTLHRILEKLCILEGERVSYRTLDVEEIGSVYQTIMGFGVETAAGTAIALKGKRKNGGVPASPVISLEQLLAIPAKDRAKWLKENADTELTGEADKRLKSAATVDDLLVALEKRIDRHATPAPVAQGGLVLQPTDERRRSGSHYTPRSFTEPIVRKTLEPILKNLGRDALPRVPNFPSAPQAQTKDGAAEHRSPTGDGVPTPDQILSLKICDIAVGSAAFLVETCRQLADVLVKAWRVHGRTNGGRPQVLPPDETEELLAMRLIAQRCLYGVDRNPMATDLAKLSLWLATLAKDHPFTFLDHAIRCGDSLVGLTRQQIEDFTWRDTRTSVRHFFSDEVRKRTAAALRERQNLLGLGDDYGTPQLKRERLEKADELLDLVRFIGDAAVAAFFAADKDKAREAKRVELADRISEYLRTMDMKLRPTAEVKALRGELASSVQPAASGEPAETARHSPLTAHPVFPFHWEIEYPEVFDRENPGFDAFVGNPPFAGRTTLSESTRDGYIEWLQILHEESHGNADLVAHFFRRVFSFLRIDGCFGLISTKTIGQGDTRSTGLRWIGKHGGTIYSARKRQKWPGQAAVVVSIVWVAKGSFTGPLELDARPVPFISAYLFHAGGHDDPEILTSNSGKSFQGCVVVGMGFTFDDTDANGVASPVALMNELINRDARNAERIFPFIGGEEVNDHPEHRNHRFVINFGDLSEDEVRRNWPDLMRIVEERVKPERESKAASGSPDKVKRGERWWQFARTAKDLYEALRGRDRALVIAQTSNSLAFAFEPTDMVFGHTLIAFPLDTFGSFACLQNRSHYVWAQFFAATMKDDLRYIPTDCFATFPFPAGFETNAALEAAGREYYEFRAALMQDLWLGLTEIYNLFHSPDDEALARLETLYRKRAAFSSPSPREARAGRGPGRGAAELGTFEQSTSSPQPSPPSDGGEGVKSDWRTAESVPADRSPLTLYATPAAALAGVCRLRELHAAMDAAVLTAYGWTDLLPQCTCEFLLDYEDEDSESAAEESGGRKKKKPWRYRWPDEIRDEVLARLLKLNADRAEEERIAGLAAALAESSKPKRPRSKKSPAAPAQGDLLPSPQPDFFA